MIKHKYFIVLLAFLMVFGLTGCLFGANNTAVQPNQAIIATGANQPLDITLHPLNYQFTSGQPPVPTRDPFNPLISNTPATDQTQTTGGNATPAPAGTGGPQLLTVYSTSGVPHAYINNNGKYYDLTVGQGFDGDTVTSIDVNHGQAVVSQNGQAITLHIPGATK
jgi:hypothetical protein